MSGVFGQWAETYGREPNALLALGDRALKERLGDLRGLRVLDAGCGTGRWMRIAAEASAYVTGFDSEPAMLRQAPAGCVALGDLQRPPFRDGTFDLAIAAFSLSYAERPDVALAAVARLVGPGGGLMVVDLHPDALEDGWKRTFSSGGETLEVPSRVRELDAALLQPPSGWRLAALDSVRFSEAERPLFTEERWARVRRVWAVRLAVWRQPD